MKELLLLNASILGFVHILWTKQGTLNLMIKTLLFFLAIANMFMSYQQYEIQRQATQAVHNG